MLDKTASSYPDNDAVVCGESRLTYQALREIVLRLANGLGSLGISESDCIALVLPNCPEFLISFFAVSRLHAIALLLNPSFKESELRHYIEDSKTKLIITDAARAETCQALIDKSDQQIKLVVVGDNPPCGVAFEDVVQGASTGDPSIGSYEGAVLYQYTSGSTGKPKRVSRTQVNVFSQARSCVETLGVTMEDSIFCSVPMYHAYGFGECLLAATCSGAKLVILEPYSKDGVVSEIPFVFRRPRVLELIKAEKISILPSVPYVYSILASTPPDPTIDLSTLRLCISAGNFLAKDIFDKFLLRFGLPIRQLYGCTEAGSVAINMEASPEHRYDSVGQPMQDVEIKVIGDDGNEAQPGVTGELAIKSNTLTQGYHDAPEVNKEVFREGHYFTSDLGTKDKDGYIFITGRKKIFIDTGGHKVDPFEIENLLATHPNVKEVVVVGTKRPYAGEVIKAVVVAEGECEESSIISYCQDKLADFKTPRIVEFRDEIPKSALGKILRKDLI
ncbi:MAG: AMP-binding protein [Cyanobacteria bacterium P01_A01_bin.17]